MSDFPTFRREVIWQGPPAERTSCVVGDLDGDGVPEIVIASRAPKVEAMLLDRGAGGAWRASVIDDTFTRAEAGGCLAPIAGGGRTGSTDGARADGPESTGSGDSRLPVSPRLPSPFSPLPSRLDLVLACDYKGNEVYWWENPWDGPEDPPRAWKRHLIARMPANQSHDQMIADVDGDGRLELYFWNQQASALFCVPVPDDPRAEPWPGLHAVAGGLKEEGLSVADVDGDGKLELIAGLSWYRPLGGRLWERHEFARGFVSPKSVAADFDGDGRPEIVISEGDASLNKRQFGRVVLFKAGKRVEDLWEPHILHDHLLEPHSLAAADFDGDGRPDLFVGEMGLPNGENPHPPALRIWQNLGGGRFAERIIDEGIGTHEAKAIVLDGRVGIAGKPFRLLNAASREPEVDCVHLWLPE